jgi:hypothetical protein
MSQEVEDVGRNNVGRTFRHDREERFEIVGYGPQGVGSGSPSDELKVRVHQRITQREAELSTRRLRSDQVREIRHPQMLPPQSEKH